MYLRVREKKHVSDIPFVAEIRKYCAVDRGNRDGRENVPGPEIVKIDRL